MKHKRIYIDLDIVKRNLIIVITVTLVVGFIVSYHEYNKERNAMIEATYTEFLDHCNANNIIPNEENYNRFINNK